MKKIKLIDFLEYVNFRKGENLNDYNTSIIRIYYPKDGCSSLDLDNYFEYGVYDYSYDTRKRIIQTLNPNILNLYVYEVNTHKEGYLEIYVDTEKEIDDINIDYYDYPLNGYENDKNKDMEKIYVCSPLRGNEKENIKRAEEYCRKIVLKLNAIPICPHIYFTRFLNDNSKIERELGLDLGQRLLKDCDRVFVFDDYGISEGMKKEIEVAESLNIPVIYTSGVNYLYE